MRKDKYTFKNYPHQKAVIPLKRSELLDIPIFIYQPATSCVLTHARLKQKV